MNKSMPRRWTLSVLPLAEQPQLGASGDRYGALKECLFMLAMAFAMSLVFCGQSVVEVAINVLTR